MRAVHAASSWPPRGSRSRSSNEQTPGAHVPLGGVGRGNSRRTRLQCVVMARPDERREFQRLTLNPPVPGTLDTAAVSILEIGVLGGRVQHGARFDTTKSELRFSYRDSEVALRCEIVRTSESGGKYPGAGFESGLRFVAAIGESGE